MVLSTFEEDLGSRIIEAGGPDAFLAKEIRDSVSTNQVTSRLLHHDLGFMC